ECEKVVMKWFRDLTPDQRDPSRCDENDDAQRLLMALNDGNKPFEAKVTQVLPSAWGLGKLAEWTSFQTTAFKSKWEESKKVVEEIKPLVPDPIALPEELATEVKPNMWEVEDGAKIRIDIPPGAKSVLYAFGGEDPANALERITLNESSLVAVDLQGKPTGEL